MFCIFLFLFALKTNLHSISVALASYNGSKYIEAQIDSILTQTLPPFEIVISDDCSSDNTIEIIQKYCDQNSLIKLLPTKSRLGVVKNFENAFRNCSGNYIAFSDQDDIWLPEKLEKSYILLQKMEQEFGSTTPCLVFTDLQVVDDSLNQISPSYIQSNKLAPQNTSLSNLLVENVCTGCTILFNRSLADLISIFPPNIVMHDMFVAMVASSFGKISCLNESTIMYRQHQNNVMGLSKNGFQKIINNTLGVLFNKNKKELFLEKEIQQAFAFYEIYHERLPKEVNEMLLGFISLKLKSKISRIEFLIRNNVIKGNALRNLNLLLKV